MISYEDANLQKLFEELEPKRRKQALKGALRKASTNVRKEAVANLRKTGIRTDRDLERGIRRVVYKKTLGFRVTIGTKGGKKKGFHQSEVGFHTNRRGLKKPVLPWAELGTEERYTKTKTKIFTRKRKGHYTGRMKEYGFMGKTKTEVSPKITDELHREIVESIERTARKYGCK